MAGLTACGSNESEQQTGNIYPEEYALNLAANLAEILDQATVVSNGASDYIAGAAAFYGLDQDMLEGAVASWMSAAEDMGNYVEVMEIVDNTVLCEEYNGNFYPIGGAISARLKGSSHNAILEFTCDEVGITSMSVNVEYSFGESMWKAFLNTVLGMGTVFVVLILISLIIAAFGFIPKLTEKNKQPVEKKEDAVVAQIAEREELSDDTELVAVIAAAIAAYEGAGSTDGFVVRSIRKAKNNKW